MRAIPLRDRADGALQAHPRRVRVLVGDGYRSFIEALVMRLDGEDLLQVVAGVLRPDEALRAVQAHPVDVALLTVGGLDSFLPHVPELRAVRPEVKLVALAEGQHLQLLAEAVRHGFRGWVPKESGVDELIDAVFAVDRGETRIPARQLTGLLEVLLDEDEGRSAARAQLAVLTRRERQVLAAMVHGAGRDEVADELGVSTHTARTHVQNILTKLDVHSSLSAVALARRAGLS